MKQPFLNVFPQGFICIGFHQCIKVVGVNVQLTGKFAFSFYLNHAVRLMDLKGSFHQV